MIKQWGKLDHETKTGARELMGNDETFSPVPR